MFPNHWWFSENKIIGKNPEKNNFKINTFTKHTN